MHAVYPRVALLLLAFYCGCNGNHGSTSQTVTTNNMAEKTEAQSQAAYSAITVPEIEPGYYREGDDYEQVSSVLAESDASIILDYHSGIEWYDKSTKKRVRLDDINDVKSLLSQTEERRVVTVSTGKTAWDKYDLYIDKVAEFADELGFDITVVTDDTAQGLIISNVIRHDNKD